MIDLQVHIPTVPDSVLLPNSRAHRLKRNAEAQAQRAVARLATQQALSGTVDATAFELDITVSWPKGRRRPDLDNCIACLKSTIDGIADAIGIDDRHMTGIRVAQRMSNNGGGVDVRIVFCVADQQDGPRGNRRRKESK